MKFSFYKLNLSGFYLGFVLVLLTFMALWSEQGLIIVCLSTGCSWKTTQPTSFMNCTSLAYYTYCNVFVLHVVLRAFVCRWTGYRIEFHELILWWVFVFLFANMLFKYVVTWANIVNVLFDKTAWTDDRADRVHVFCAFLNEIQN